MKCQKCDNEATVHEVMIKGGKQVEKHLCEICAKAEGFAVQSKGQVATLLTQFLATQVTPTAQGEGVRSACRSCGTTYAQFRATGDLGCPDCYAAFDAQLGPLLERAHEGGGRHVGKVPKRLAHLQRAAMTEASELAPKTPPAPSTGAPSGPVKATRTVVDPHVQLASLRAQLQGAVAGERYEDAARLRDQLKTLESGANEAQGEAGIAGQVQGPNRPGEQPT
ncbi:MAG: UvrB/UvrC motif-containing protein [Phycisphaerales bacterium]|nr:UvrB/UvrC motif-containing protein [Phycisphaerales bacterium]